MLCEPGAASDWGWQSTKGETANRGWINQSFTSLRSEQLASFQHKLNLQELETTIKKTKLQKFKRDTEDYKRDCV